MSVDLTALTQIGKQDPLGLLREKAVRNAKSLHNLLHGQDDLSDNKLRRLLNDILSNAENGQELLVEAMISWRHTYLNQRQKKKEAENQLLVATGHFGKMGSEILALKQEVEYLQKQRTSNLNSILRTSHGFNSLVFSRRKMTWDTYHLKMNIGERIQCCHCGKLLTFKEFTVEHLRPLALGGTDDIDNLRGACSLCNSQRPLEDIYHKFNPSE